jgi:hypothetical protein
LFQDFTPGRRDGVRGLSRGLRLGVAVSRPRSPAPVDPRRQGRAPTGVREGFPAARHTREGWRDVGCFQGAGGRDLPGCSPPRDELTTSPPWSSCSALRLDDHARDSPRVPSAGQCWSDVHPALWLQADSPTPGGHDLTACRVDGGPVAFVPADRQPPVPRALSGAPASLLTVSTLVRRCFGRTPPGSAPGAV